MMMMMMIMVMMVMSSHHGANGFESSNVPSAPHPHLHRETGPWVSGQYGFQWCECVISALFPSSYHHGSHQSLIQPSWHEGALGRVRQATVGPATSPTDEEVPLRVVDRDRPCLRMLLLTACGRSGELCLGAAVVGQLTPGEREQGEERRAVHAATADRFALRNSVGSSTCVCCMPASLASSAVTVQLVVI